VQAIANPLGEDAARGYVCSDLVHGDVGDVPGRRVGAEDRRGDWSMDRELVRGIKGCGVSAIDPARDGSIRSDERPPSGRERFLHHCETQGP
jgi:hypothetical protein